MTINRSVQILFVLFILTFSASAQDVEITSGQQKVSTGAIWFEYRQHTAKNEYPTIVFESGALSYSNYWNPVIELPMGNGRIESDLLLARIV